jgi:hypothetical protein
VHLTDAVIGCIVSQLDHERSAHEAERFVMPAALQPLHCGTLLLHCPVSMLHPILHSLYHGFFACFTLGVHPEGRSVLDYHDSEPAALWISGFSLHYQQEKLVLTQTLKARSTTQIIFCNSKFPTRKRTGQARGHRDGLWITLRDPIGY